MTKIAGRYSRLDEGMNGHSMYREKKGKTTASTLVDNFPSKACWLCLMLAMLC